MKKNFSIRYLSSYHPAENYFIVRLKFQKRSELKFVSRTIPQSGGYNTPQLAAELFPKLALGFIPVILLPRQLLFLSEPHLAIHWLQLLNVPEGLWGKSRHILH